MYVSVTTEAAVVEVSDEGEGYNPDVMNDLCARAVTTTVEVHRELASLEVD